MVTNIVLILLCMMSAGTIVYFTRVFHNLESNFDAVDYRFTALEKLFMKVNRNVETHSETFHDTYIQIGKLKTDYERLRCYVYNNIPAVTEQEEEGTENADKL